MRSLMGCKCALVVLLGCVLVAFASANAQGGNGQNENPQSQDPQSAGKVGTTADQAAPAVAMGDVDPDPAVVPITAPNVQPIREIGRANPLPVSLGPTHLGPIYLRSVGVSYLWDINSGSSSSPTAPTLAVPDIRAVTIDGLIGAQKLVHRTALALQYRPHLSVVNGHFDNALSNQNLSVDTSFGLAPRWSLKLSDVFTYVGKQSQYGDTYLNYDTTTFATLQNQFLDSNLNSIWNTSVATVDHQLSARTSISFGGGYIYARSEREADTITQKSYTASTGLTRSIGRSSSIGGFYQAQQLKVSEQKDTTLYQSMGLNFGHAFTRTVQVSGTLGASVGSFRSGQVWTMIGSGSIMKAFRRASVVATYMRNAGLSGFITNSAVNDRGDLSFRTTFARRIGFNASGGYFHGTTLGARAVTGKYATTQLSYRIKPRLAWQFTYAHKFQNGDGMLVASGIRDFFSVGLQWTPGVSPTQ